MPFFQPLEWHYPLIEAELQRFKCRTMRIKISREMNIVRVTMVIVQQRLNRDLSGKYFHDDRARCKQRRIGRRGLLLKSVQNNRGL